MTAVEQAHEVMRTHLPGPDGWCPCGERWPCTRRRDALSLLIQVGHIVLAAGGVR